MERRCSGDGCGGVIAMEQSPFESCDLPGFRGWVIHPAPPISSAQPMLVSPDGHTAVRLDVAERISATWPNAATTVLRNLIAASDAFWDDESGPSNGVEG